MSQGGNLPGQKEQDVLLLQSQGENNNNNHWETQLPCALPVCGKGAFPLPQICLTLSLLFCREHASYKAKGKAAQPSLWIRTSRNFSQLLLQLCPGIELG